MVSVDIEIQGVDESNANFERMSEALQNAGEGLLEVVESTLLPAIEDASATVWNVRTGAYSTGWIAEITDPNTVTITNSVEYAAPLEYGWTTRNGGVVESQGVADPTTLEMGNAIAEGLAGWLNSQISQ